jgi:hypothetical protein
MGEVQLSKTAKGLHNCLNTRTREGTDLRRAPPGRLGSSLMRFPAISLRLRARNAASAARTS